MFMPVFVCLSVCLPTLLTTSNVALELKSVNGASVTLVQLPLIPYLTALDLPLTLIDLKVF